MLNPPPYLQDSQVSYSISIFYFGFSADTNSRFDVKWNPQKSFLLRSHMIGLMLGSEKSVPHGGLYYISPTFFQNKFNFDFDVTNSSAGSTIKTSMSWYFNSSFGFELGLKTLIKTSSSHYLILKMLY
jgi:hypothetical protein